MCRAERKVSLALSLEMFYTEQEKMENRAGKRMRRETAIENEIGKIFKKYNIIEYKSPEDGLTIDDYYKVMGYACLYKGFGVSVNQIPAEELAVSFVREAYPRELFGTLEKMGLVRRERFPGIYHIEGNLLFPTQVVVTSRLEKNMHRALRILSKHAEKEDAQEFIKKLTRIPQPLQAGDELCRVLPHMH